MGTHARTVLLHAPLTLFVSAGLAICIGCNDDDGDTGSDPVDPDAGAIRGDAGPSTQPDAQPTDTCPLPNIEPVDGLVPTEQGPVQGASTDGVWSWKGIPFATPPVGDLRFRPPQPPACRDATLPATSFGPRCPQVDLTNPFVLGTQGEEDCLTLNVWSPTPGASDDPKPVMVFIHGGGGVVGSASDELAPGVPFYSGRHLAARGAVVVTLQYRLGAFGFLSLPELDAEAGAVGSGNNGHLDQIAALRWVRRNIGAFGGDPARVLLVGQSAGGVSACVLVASPVAADLFQRAAVHSGPCLARPLEDSRRASRSLAEMLGCGTQKTSSAACAVRRPRTWSSPGRAASASDQARPRAT
jgi:para-nitrobenzyl esterase